MLAPEWDVLDQQVLPRTPYTSPLWNILWWKHFHEDRFLVRDEFFAHAVRDWQGGLIAVAPMMLTHRPSTGPLRLRQLQFFGADPNITEIRGMICRSQEADRAMESLVHALNERGSEWDWLDWRGIRINGDAPCFLEREHLLDHVSVTPDYLLPLPGSWETFKASQSRNVKEAMRKCYNSLSREGFTAEFRVVKQAAEVSSALDRFFTLHAARANMEFAVVHRDAFRSGRSRAFMAEFAQCMAERDQLRIFQVLVGGEVVATRIGFLLGNELYLHFSGFDPIWARFSIMTTVLAETIRWAIGCGLKSINLSTGSDRSKMRWRPTEILFGNGKQRSPGSANGLPLRVYEVLHQIHQYDSALARFVAGRRA